MHRVLQPFEFLEPESIDEVLQLLSTHGDKAKVMAGGVDLVLKMRLREIQPQYVISLQKVGGLDYISGDKENGLRIGALGTLREIELSAVVRNYYPLLYEAVHQIASIQVKVMGTAVGNLCVATPASDISPVLIVLGAEAKIVGDGIDKSAPIARLFVDVNKTVLEPQEVITEVFVPPVPTGTGCAFMKLGKTAEDIAKVNAAVRVTVTGNICNDVRIALGSVAPTPVRVTEAENIIKEEGVDEKAIDKAAKAAAEAVRPISDVRSTATYRKEMTRVLVKDALKKASGRVNGEE